MSTSLADKALSLAVIFFMILLLPVFIVVGMLAGPFLLFDYLIDDEM
jgi:hypothetical protein